VYQPVHHATNEGCLCGDRLVAGRFPYEQDPRS
jgi:hypothetical protein